MSSTAATPMMVSPRLDPFGLHLERNFWRYAAILTICFLVSSLLQDLRMKMWCDELFTLYMARQGSPTEIVKATLEGVDASPPLYPIMVSPLLHILRQDGLAVRLPSTLGFAVMLLCILGFCHRRMPAAYAFVAALLVGISSKYFATEGRSYGLVLGCAAGALFLWQTAHQERRRSVAIVGLALCLMAMTGLHYYSIFFVGPLVLGELVCWHRTKRFDWPLFLALASPLLVIAIHLPLIVAFRRMSPTYWLTARSSWGQIPHFYFQFALIPLAALVLGLILMALLEPPHLLTGATPALPPHEWVAIAAIALMPVAVVAASNYTVHLFIGRYALSSNIGIGILATCLLLRSSRQHSGSIVTVLGLLLVVAIVQQFLFTNRFTLLHMTHLRSDAGLRQSETLWQELRALPESSEPIVIGYDIVFPELWYYSKEPVRSRLVCPLSRKLNLQYLLYDVDYLNYSAMRHRTDLPLVELDAFLSANPRFILAVEPTMDYLSGYLQSQGYRVTPIDSRAAPLLYEVERP